MTIQGIHRAPGQSPLSHDHLPGFFTCSRSKLLSPTHHGFVGLFSPLSLLLTFFAAKHFLDDPSSLVVQSLQGLCAINPKLGLDVNNKVVFLANQDKSRVGLICGGGSGHEPSHAGFVGQIISDPIILHRSHNLGRGMLSGNSDPLLRTTSLTLHPVSCRMR